MNILGVDVSTRSVACAFLDFDSDRATVRTYEVPPDVTGDALERARTLADLLPRRRASGWDETALVAIERPFGIGTRAVGDMMLVVGIVVACLPPQIPVWLLGPTEWRKACGLAGNASKDDVRAFVTARWTGDPTRNANPASWSQDLCDAWCVAYGARALNAAGQVAA